MSQSKIRKYIDPEFDILKVIEDKLGVGYKVVNIVR